jgi:hypothetical protein
LAFSYWFDSTLVSQLREDLLLCSSYLPLGVPNELFLQAIIVHQDTLDLESDAAMTLCGGVVVVSSVHVWRVPPKVKLFVWKDASDGLSMRVIGYYNICCAKIEDVTHALFRCPMLRIYG